MVISEILVQIFDTDNRFLFGLVVAHLLFHLLHEVSQTQSHDPVHQRNRDVRFPVAGCCTGNGTCGVSQFSQTDGRNQRRVFQNGNRVVAQRRKHTAESLRQDDVEHGLPVSHTDGAGSFHLPFIQRLDTGTENLGKVSTGIQCNGYDAGEHRTVCGTNLTGKVTGN